jgi:dTDP-4-dehydrorhamnose reductase
VSAAVRFVITGISGKIAQSLVGRAAAGNVDVEAVGRPSLDLTDPDSIAPAIHAARPDIIVSAAAYTNVERAESEPNLATAVNIRGAEALAICARSLDIPIIHLSSSYVFDGAQTMPYRETDPAEPLSVYGQSKLLGERAVAKVHPEHVILRMSWVYSAFGRNFVTEMLRQAKSSDTVRVVQDQIGNPASAVDIADAIFAVGKRIVSGRSTRENYGTFHLSAPDAITPTAFAAAIFAESGKCGGPKANVAAITRAEYASKHTRPKNAALDSTKIARVHGISLPPLERSLGMCIKRILGNQA